MENFIFCAVMVIIIITFFGLGDNAKLLNTVIIVTVGHEVVNVWLINLHFAQ